MRSDGIRGTDKAEQGDPEAAELGLSGAPGAVPARVRRNIRRWTAGEWRRTFSENMDKQHRARRAASGRVMFLRDCLGTEIVKSPRKLEKDRENGIRKTLINQWFQDFLQSMERLFFSFVMRRSPVQVRQGADEWSPS